MKLDRNLNPDSRGKYALLRLRNTELSKAKIRDVITNNIGSNVLQFGDTEQSEFFVLKLKDKYAAAALFAYAHEIGDDDPEYAEEVVRLANKSLHHPLRQIPD